MKEQLLIMMTKKTCVFQGSCIKNMHNKNMIISVNLSSFQIAIFLTRLQQRKRKRKISSRDYSNASLSSISTTKGRHEKRGHRHFMQLLHTLQTTSHQVTVIIKSWLCNLHMSSQSPACLPSGQDNHSETNSLGNNKRHCLSCFGFNLFPLWPVNERCILETTT